MLSAAAERSGVDPQISIDGGDLACGELLMLVHRRLRGVAPGTLIAIITTDPAAPIDIPAWCHLTGHRYRGPAGTPRCYLVEVVAASRRVDPANPWRAT
ncbi:sulfurtransferase TusA family protein [Sporichthya sp.]|uniref:sulfurtransferase TusA family protein n=1 Tax=Sporichthya sp. TaxID=65475 RepID=UPI0025EBFEE5|nr:sulfurtransferase TusA family protein [Sporichthya sp.]